MERLKEANAYAEMKGLRKFDLVSNNFSLARMVSPVWDGCVAASDPSFKAWLSAWEDSPWDLMVHGTQPYVRPDGVFQRWM